MSGGDGDQIDSAPKSREPSGVLDPGLMGHWVSSVHVLEKEKRHLHGGHPRQKPLQATVSLLLGSAEAWRLCG